MGFTTSRYSLIMTTLSCNVTLYDLVVGMTPYIIYVRYWPCWVMLQSLNMISLRQPFQYRLLTPTAAALLGQEIFVAGGQACKEIINDAEVYNPQINQWEQIVCRMDSPRVGLAMVSIGNLIYVMGKISLN